jgi:hypothetical protein
MSLLARFTPVSATLEQYEESLQRLQSDGGEWPPDGLELHVCFGQEDNIRVSEVWESQEKFAAFGERLMPLLADIGIEPGEPEILDVHNVIKA